MHFLLADPKEPVTCENSALSFPDLRICADSVRGQSANVCCSLSDSDGSLCAVTDRLPAQPPWGRYIQERRERQNRSIRQVSYGSGISDSYWGQVERGYQTTADGHRVISPSRSKLLEMAECLRLSPKDTNELLQLAGFHPLASGTARPPGRGEDVDLRGLSLRDIRLLNLFADRLRESTGAEEDPPVVTPLRRVASGRPARPAPEREAAAEKRAREAAKNNPQGKRPR